MSVQLSCNDKRSDCLARTRARATSPTMQVKQVPTNLHAFCLGCMNEPKASRANNISKYLHDQLVGALRGLSFKNKAAMED